MHYMVKSMWAGHAANALMHMTFILWNTNEDAMRN